MCDFFQMTSAEVDELLTGMGVASEQGVGIPYHTLVPHLVKAIDNRINND